MLLAPPDPPQHHRDPGAAMGRMDEFETGETPDLTTLLADLRELNQRLTAANERIAEACAAMRARGGTPGPSASGPDPARDG